MANSIETLQRYAQTWNAHPSLQGFGVRLTFPSTDRVQIDVESVLPTMRGGLGDDAVVNGGALSGLCDLVIGCTSALVDPTSRSATVQLNIRFERPLAGDRIHGEAHVDRSTGRLIFSSAELSDAAGQVCVRCQGIVTLLRR